MPRGEPRSRIRKPPVHCATQGPPVHASKGAPVEGVGIAHGGAPARWPPQHLRQVPVPKAAGPFPRSRLVLCRLSAVSLKLGLGLLGIPSLERIGAAGCVGVGGGI